MFSAQLSDMVKINTDIAQCTDLLTANTFDLAQIKLAVARIREQTAKLSTQVLSVSTDPRDCWSFNLFFLRIEHIEENIRKIEAHGRYYYDS